jgi:hypothetical protein
MTTLMFSSDRMIIFSFSFAVIIRLYDNIYVINCLDDNIYVIICLGDDTLFNV